MEFRILGPLEVVSEGPRTASGKAASAAGDAAAPRERAGLERPADRGSLGGRPPATAAKVLQTYVSQLRKALGKEAIVTGPAATSSASSRTRRSPPLRAARGEARGASRRRSRGLREALALWRGPPLADFAYEPWAQTEIGRLEELRLEALQERIDADLALGRARRARRRARASGRRAPASSACAAS